MFVRPYVCVCARWLGKSFTRIEVCKFGSGCTETGPTVAPDFGFFLLVYDFFYRILRQFYEIRKNNHSLNLLAQ